MENYLLPKAPGNVFARVINPDENWRQMAAMRVLEPRKRVQRLLVTESATVNLAAFHCPNRLEPTVDKPLLPKANLSGDEDDVDQM